MRAVSWSPLLLSACSFFTDFPDVTPLGGGGAGASGGAGAAGSGAGGDGGTQSGGGGAGPTCDSDCLNCVGPSCPSVPTALFDALSGSSTSPPGPQDGIGVNDVVRAGSKTWLIGNYNDTMGQSATFDGVAFEGLQAGAFLLESTGNVRHVMRPCDDTGTRPALFDEVFYFAGTGADQGAEETLVVAGAMQAGSVRLLTSPTDLACPSVPNSALDGPGNAPQTAPFLLWFDAESGLLEKSFMPPSSRAATSEHGYISDVAALPGSPNAQVFALGMAQVDPFQSEDFGPTDNSEYYVIRTAGASATYQAMARLMVQSCVAEPNAVLDGLRSSIAVSSDAEVWVGVTGCALNSGVSPDRGTLFHLDQDLATLSSPRVLGGAGDPVSVTEVTVVDDPPLLIVAGTYSGNPGGFMSDVPTGQDGDGFVVAFNRDVYSDQSTPLWFQRIGSDGPMTLDSLTVHEGVVYVGGSGGSSLSVGALDNCVDSETPGRGRSLIVALDIADGTPRWLRADGTTAPNNPEPLGEAFARTTALGVHEGALVAATSSYRRLVFECGGGATPGGPQPRFDVRTFGSL
jgi:hypothetical protein